MPLPREYQCRPVLEFTGEGHGVVRCGQLRGWTCRLLRMRLIKVDGQLLVWDGQEAILASDVFCDFAEAQYHIDLVGCQGGEAQHFYFRCSQVDMMHAWWSLPCLVIVLGLAKVGPPSRYIHKRWSSWEKWWASMELGPLHLRRSLPLSSSSVLAQSQEEGSSMSERVLRCYSLSTFALLVIAAKLAFSPMCHAAEDNKAAWRGLMQGLARSVSAGVPFDLPLALDPDRADLPGDRFVLKLQPGSCMVQVAALKSEAAARGLVSLIVCLDGFGNECEMPALLGALLHHKMLWPIAVDAMRILAWQLERLIKSPDVVMTDGALACNRGLARVFAKGVSRSGGGRAKPSQRRTSAPLQHKLFHIPYAPALDFKLIVFEM